MNFMWDSFKMLAAISAGVTGGVATERVIDAGTHVPLGVVVSVVVTAVGIAIAISRAMQRLQDSIEDLHSNVKSIETKMATLPCQSHLKCEEEKKDVEND
jgi:hypothetical protein